MDEKISVITYLLVVIFGSSSWLSTNSVWMELPLLTATLPEQWQLPSYLAVIVQIACIGPILYSIVRKCLYTDIRPAPVIAGMLAFGCVCTALLAAFWHRTAMVANEWHSVALFVIFFGLAIVNCTSNVLFLPYMAAFHHSYFTAYFVGMGLSALFPSVVSLIQGAGQFHCISVWQNETNATKLVPEYVEPRFGVTAYNLVMFGWMMLATVAFILLHWTRLGHAEPAEKPTVALDAESTEISPLNCSSTACSNGNRRSSTEEVAIIDGRKRSTDVKAADASSPIAHHLSRGQYAYLLTLTAWVCAMMNGIIPSIQSFASLPYGQTVYHLALALSNIANPVACFVPIFVRVRSLPLLSALTLLATVFSGYIVLLASLSPDPPLLDSGDWGGFLCVLAAVVALGVQAFLRTAMAGILREGAGDSESRLFWCGVFTQLGSFLGAALLFPLVSVWKVFKMAPACR